MITPSLNGARFVEGAIRSVLAQGYPDVEHIVLDAGSRDGTLAVYARYPHLRLVVEPDKGPHDAMNKGLRLATGEIIGFLNTDDDYREGVFFEVAKLFRDEPALDAVSGGFAVLAEGGGGEAREIVRYERPEGDGFGLDLLALGAPGFNARFFRRRLFERVGPFDNGYDISGDREFLLRAALAGLRAQALPRLVYCYRRHAASRTLDANRQNRLAIAREHVRLAERLLARPALAPPARRALGRLYAYESAKLVLAALAGGDGLAALRRLAAMARLGPALPLVLLDAALVRRRLLKG